MSTIALVGAMQEEVEALYACLAQPRLQRRAGRDFVRGRLDGQRRFEGFHRLWIALQPEQAEAGGIEEVMISRRDRQAFAQQCERLFVTTGLGVLERRNIEERRMAQSRRESATFA